MDSTSCRAQPVCARFDGLGPSIYTTDDTPAEAIDVGDDAPATRRRIREECPQLAGVYGMIDQREELIYIGMSKNLRERLLTYFYQSRADSKQRNIAKYTQRLIWETSTHELTALLRELELIRRWRPALNVKGQPGRTRGGYVFLTATDAPQFRIDQLPPRHYRSAWGPVPLNYRMRTAVERINHIFKLRDCAQRTPMRFPDQRELFDTLWPAQCERGELETCLAPCAGRCTRREYSDQIAAACALIESGDATVLNELVSSIDDALFRNEFDEASSLQQSWDDLVYLCEQVRLAREVRRAYSFVYELPVTLNRTLWIPVTSGHVTTVVDAPNSPESAQRCLALMESVFAPNRWCQVDDFEIVRLVTSWFRRNPKELNRAIDPAHVIEQCRKQTLALPIAA